MAENKQLGNGLELRVESAFDFLHGDVQDREGSLIVTKKQVRGIDVSLFRNQKLCLSPLDNYYYLREFERDISREDLGQIPLEQYQGIIERIARGIDPSLIRVYEILDFDLLGHDFNLKDRQYLLFDKNLNHLKVSNLFLFSNLQLEPDIINRCWMSRYGVRTTWNGARFPDRMKGNAFSLFFVDPEVLDYDRPFEKEAANVYHQYHDNSRLVSLSRASIHSYSYGYRMRLIGIDRKTVLSSIK